MKLHPLAYVAVGGLLGLIGVISFNLRNTPPAQSNAAIPTPATPMALPVDPGPGSNPYPPGSTPAGRPLPPPPEAVADAESVQRMFLDFRTRVGENPVGTNAEIMRSVMGGNRFQAQLGPPEGQALNDQGELLDRWGTPYFFHQLSKEQMEVRSAGPDRTMWTTDDVVLK